MSNSLYVGNLSYDTTEEELFDLFDMGSKYARKVRIALDRESGQSRGFAFVDMVSDRAAEIAIGTLNGTRLAGREIRVRIAEDRKDARPVIRR